MDIAFNEDQSRLHKDSGAENLAVIRHIALNLLRNEKTAKVGIKAKSPKVGWDDAYLFKILFAYCNRPNVIPILTKMGLTADSAYAIVIVTTK